MHPKVARSVPDTPRKHRISHDLNSRLYSLEEAREQVLKDMPAIPVVAFDQFANFVLPHVDDAVLNAIFRDLKRNQIVVDNRWRAFPQNPIAVNDLEDVVFSPLQMIWKAVATSERFSSLVDLKHQPHSSSVSERYNTSLPDGSLVLKNTTSVTCALRPPYKNGEPRIFWEDTVVVNEYKKGKRLEDFFDSCAKTVYNCTHIMRNDPRRLFTFGLSIVNEELRVWYFSRAGTLVTEPIQWLTDPKHLIRIFAGFASADERALGYDPTVRRVYAPDEEDTCQIQYEYEVDRRTFVTTGAPLFDFKADLVEGRATRVWRAYDRSDLSRTVRALKDVWIDIDAVTEGDILRKVYDELGEFGRESFLTVLCHGNVMVKDSKDTTKANLRGEPKVIDFCIPTKPRAGLLYNSSPTISGSGSRLHSVGHVPTIRHTKQIDRRGLVHRTHYRIVFKEVGTPLHEIFDLQTVFSALIDAVAGLQRLHQLGIVHRDISTGNILLYRGKGLLCDLEYAKSLDDTSSTHDVKTGTPQFMAVEVAEGRFLFLNKAEDNVQTLTLPADITPGQTPLHTVFETQPLPLSRSSTFQETPFRYGVLHDLESIWWITVWFLFLRPLDGPMEDKDEESSAQLADRYFSGTSSHRRYLLTSTMDWVDVINSIPTPSKPAAHVVNTLRDWLTRTYKSSYETMDPNTGVPKSIGTMSTISIYDVFRYFLQQVGPTPIRVLRRNKRSANSPDTSVKKMRRSIKTSPAKSSRMALSGTGQTLRRSIRLRKHPN